MKKQIILSALIFTVLLASTLFAGATIIDIVANSDGENIAIRWNTAEEINMQHFMIERKSVNSAFGSISELIEAKGDNSSYEYIDENAYKTSDVVYIYRLKIVEESGNVSYSGEISVSHNVSSVKRTWGSIKALFR